MPGVIPGLEPGPIPPAPGVWPPTRLVMFGPPMPWLWPWFMPMLCCCGQKHTTEASGIHGHFSDLCAIVLIYEVTPLTRK